MPNESVSVTPLPMEQFEARLAEELEERTEFDWQASVTVSY